MYMIMWVFQTGAWMCWPQPSPPHPTPTWEAWSNTRQTLYVSPPCSLFFSLITFLRVDKTHCAHTPLPDHVRVYWDTGAVIHWPTPRLLPYPPLLLYNHGNKGHPSNTFDPAKSSTFCCILATNCSLVAKPLQTFWELCIIIIHLFI